MKPNKYIVILSIIFFFLVTIRVFAQPENVDFPKRSVTVGENSYGYRIYVPDNYDPKKKYPVVLFLHGSDERGENNVAQISSGLPQVIRIRSRQQTTGLSSFIGVFPQCAENRFWIGDMADLAMKALGQTMKEFNTDSKKVYLTGFSLGGYGTWYLAAKYPNKFAAIVPIGGNVVPAFLSVPMKMPPMLKDAMHPDMLPLYEAPNPYESFAKAIGKTPVWVFHGENDKQVPVADARNMAKALAAINSNAKYTEYEGNGHFIYEKAYTEEKFWNWLLSKKLVVRIKRAKETKENE